MEVAVQLTQEKLNLVVDHTVWTSLIRFTCYSMWSTVQNMVNLISWVRY